MAAKTLDVSLIRLDGDTQSRSQLDQETVAAYCETWRAAPSSFPPVDVFFDGSDYWLADGFHRVLSATREGIDKIFANIHKGSARDAFLFGAKCNTAHGIRRTNEDKRFVVTRMLNDPEWGKRSDRWIAEAAGVHHTFVGNVRKQVQVATNTTCDKREGKDGKQQPASKPPKSRNTRKRYQEMLDEMDAREEAAPEAAPAPTKKATAPTGKGPIAQIAHAIEEVKAMIENLPVEMRYAAYVVLRNAADDIKELVA